MVALEPKVLTMHLEDLERYRLAPPQISVGPLRISAFTEDSFLAFLGERIEHRRGVVVTYAHLHTLAVAAKDPTVASVIRTCDICYCDGIGVAYASLRGTGRWLPKVTANNYINRLVDLARTAGWRLSLVGGEQEAVWQVASFMAAEGVRVVHWHDGHFRPEMEEDVCRGLVAAAPELVLVGLGQPFQEQFALSLHERLPTTVFLCVGGLFDFLTGREFVCPAALRAMGLEWLFRLASQPSRLWRRYLVEGPLYLLETIFRRPG